MRVTIEQREDGYHAVNEAGADVGQVLSVAMEEKDGKLLGLRAVLDLDPSGGKQKTETKQSAPPVKENSDV